MILLLSPILTTSTLSLIIHQRLVLIWLWVKHLVYHIIFILICSLKIVPWEIRNGFLFWTSLVLIWIWVLIVTLLLLLRCLISRTPSKIKEIIYSIIIWRSIWLLIVVIEVPIIVIADQSLFIVCWLVIISGVETRVLVFIVCGILVSLVISF